MLVFAFWHQREAAALLIASRYARGGSYQMPWRRALLSRSLNWLYRVGLSVDVCDLSSANRMYRADLLRRVALEGRGYDVLMEALLKVMALGGRVKEVPWHYASSNKRRAPRSTTARLIRDSAATFWRMHALRNSVDFPDYDFRAFDSRIWFQRYWQRKRFYIIRDLSPGDGRLLDAGCGTSRIITTHPEAYALDITFSRLAFLKETNPRRLQATAGALPFPDEAFDTVISSEVIEHTPERTCLLEAVRVLRSGGILVVGTPDYGRLWWPVIEKIYGWVKRGGYADEHITHYTCESLTQELKALGCEVEAVRYICGAEMIIRARKGTAASNADET